MGIRSGRPRTAFVYNPCVGVCACLAACPDRPASAPPFCLERPCLHPRTGARLRPTGYGAAATGFGSPQAASRASRCSVRLRRSSENPHQHASTSMPAWHGRVATPHCCGPGPAGRLRRVVYGRGQAPGDAGVCPRRVPRSVRRGGLAGRRTCRSAPPSDAASGVPPAPPPRSLGPGVAGLRTGCPHAAQRFSRVKERALRHWSYDNAASLSSQAAAGGTNAQNIHKDINSGDRPGAWRCGRERPGEQKARPRNGAELFVAHVRRRG